MEESKRPDKKRMDILIVEDSLTQAEQLKYLLQQNNCNVTHAVNGKIALVILEEFIPDLIISDILMPEMDGYELCRRIKDDERLKYVPVILLTSLTDPEDVLKGLTFGADNFFTKPCQEDYLISHIQEIVEHPKIQEAEIIRDEVEIFFNGKKRLITANQSQLLTLLLSTYEAAVMQNKRLFQTQEELHTLNENLEDLVEERTHELKLNEQKYQDLYGSVLQDNIELIKAQEELKQSEERYRAVTDSAVDSIITADEAGIIIGWNQGATNTFGYTDKEITGQSLTLLIPDNYKDLHMDGFNHMQKGELPYVIGKTVEFHGKRKNGEIFPVEVSMARWNTSNNQFFTGIIRDITVRKLAEEELLRAKEKAVESDQLKSAFLANMSHEIRTPMNAILGFSELLNEPDMDNENKEMFLTSINNATHQLLHIITDIVDISKLEARQEKTHPEVFNLNDLLEEIKGIFELQAKQKNLNLSLTNRFSAHLTAIWSDQKKLRQILNNIIGNALKFTEKGTIEIKVEPKEHQLIFSITDTGIGIDPSMHEVIFDRFRQVELGISRKYGGNGLGLALAKSYIELLGGTIRIDSSPGKGSTFSFEIPYQLVLSQPVLSPVEKTDSNKGTWEEKTILVAEDEEINLFYIQTVLKSTGINMVIANNGLEAVEQCKNNHDIALVLMDIKMPEMDGLTATRIIISHRQNLPIIATTAYALSSDREKCLEAGCIDYLSKPIKKDMLIDMMNKYLYTENESINCR